MPDSPRRDTLKMIRRLALLLIATLIVQHALAAPVSEAPGLAAPEEERAVAASEEPLGGVTLPEFVPSEKISAGTSVSFPTDI